MDGSLVRFARLRHISDLKMPFRDSIEIAKRRKSLRRDSGDRVEEEWWTDECKNPVQPDVRQA